MQTLTKYEATKQVMLKEILSRKLKKTWSGNIEIDATC